MPKNKTGNINAAQGFTLIEVLVSSLLIVVLGLAFLGLNQIFTQVQVKSWQNYLDVDQANSTVSTLVRELRTANFGDNGVYPLELANPNEIVFYSDIDFDGKIERVHYYLTGLSFFKGIIKPVGSPTTYPQAQELITKLTDNIRNGSTPVFTYYNGDWPADTINNPLTTPINLSRTKLVKIYLRINTEPNQPDKDFILDSYAQIRMLKDNL